MPSDEKLRNMLFERDDAACSGPASLRDAYSWAPAWRGRYVMILDHDATIDMVDDFFDTIPICFIGPSVQLPRLQLPQMHRSRAQRRLPPPNLAMHSLHLQVVAQRLLSPLRAASAAGPAVPVAANDVADHAANHAASGATGAAAGIGAQIQAEMHSAAVALQRRQRPRRRSRLAVGVAAMAMITLGLGGLLIEKTSAMPDNAPVEAVVNAPITVLRAPFAGRIRHSSAANGMTVQPGTQLFYLADDNVTPAEAQNLQARLQGARAHLVQLEHQLHQLGAADTHNAQQKDDVRLAQIDLSYQRDAASADVVLLERLLADQTSRLANLHSNDIIAGTNGIVWSVLVPEGTDVPKNAALVQLVDCAHLFIQARQPDGAAEHFAPGAPVAVSFAGSAKPVLGVVSAVQPASSRQPLAAQPWQGAGSVTIAVDPAAVARDTHAACPIGHAASVALRS